MIAAAMHAGRSRVCGLKETMQGTVIEYNERRGYCLVTTEQGPVFLPISVIKSNCFHYLAVGQRVEIDVIETARTAVSVAKIEN